MEHLSTKDLKRLLAISITLFVILLMAIIYLHVKEINNSLNKLVKMNNKGERHSEDSIKISYDTTPKINEIIEEKQNGNSIKSSSDITSKANGMTKEKRAKELIPKEEALQKDGFLDIPKVEANIEKDVKESNIKNDKIPNTFGRKVVYIYFSHNRESFLPYFRKGTIPEMAYHSKFNVTLIGERLGKTLKQYGIGNTVSNVDIISMLRERNLNFNHSYQMSRELVLNEKKSNRDLEMYFDIHRDALPRKYTTTHINGKPYAKISFVIGSAHKNYKENLNFTNTINSLIEKQYPGLSRGVIVKNQNQGNGVYNQDLSPNSVIIEMGGVENRLEELYRTADVLGNVISQYYWENAH